MSGIKPYSTPLPEAISDHVEATVEVLGILDLVTDREEATYKVSTQFASLAQSGREGEAFWHLPSNERTLHTLANALDITVDFDPWPIHFMTISSNLMHIEDLAPRLSTTAEPCARLAVHNSNERLGPLFHFVGMPFDGGNARSVEITQLQAMDKAIADYEAEGHDDFTMSPLTAGDVMMIALIHHVKGQPSPLASYGHLRVAKAESYGGDGTTVGSIRLQHSYMGSLDGDFSGGRGNVFSGVGLSVGPKNTSQL